MRTRLHHGSPRLLTLQGGRYDVPVVQQRTSVVIQQWIEIGCKLSIKTFQGCPMRRSLHHVKQGVKFIHMNHGGLSARRRELRRGASSRR